MVARAWSMTTALIARVLLVLLEIFVEVKVSHVFFLSISHVCNCRHMNFLCFLEHVCDPSPCMHEGKCTVESGHFKCHCPPLYKGDFCESKPYALNTY